MNIPDSIRANFGLPVGGAVMDRATAFFNAMYTGSGSPEGVTTAATGAFYFDLTNAVLYQKASGGGNTGWILPGNGTYASQATARGVNNKIDPTQVVASNAAAALTIATPDGTGQTVEPAIEYVPGGWNGHKWWAAVSGYAGYDAHLERPSFYYSDDGQTWTPMPGAAFPLFAAFGSYITADPELRYGPDGRMHLFFIVYGVTTSDPSRIYEMSTADGVTWTTPAIIVSSTLGVESYVSPCCIYDADNAQWVMWYTDDANYYNSVNAVYPLKRRTCAGTDPRGTWSAATTCTVNGLPASRTQWEFHIEKPGRQIHAVFSVLDQMTTSAATAKLHFGVSDDNGVTFTLNSTPLLGGGAASTAWDHDTVYRGDLVPVENGGQVLYEFYYSGVRSNVWGMGYTQLKVNPDLSGQMLPRYVSFLNTGATTWIVPPGVTKARIRAKGSGGGGGGAGSSSSGGSSQTGGGGGGAGGSIDLEVTLVPGNTLTANVGVGGTAGAGGAAGGNAGTDGGDGNFSTLVDTTASSTVLIAADGGSGGKGSTASSTAAVGGGLTALGGSNTSSTLYAGAGGQSVAASGPPTLAAVGGGGGGPASGTKGGGGGAAGTSGDLRRKARGANGASGTTAGVNGVAATAPGCGGGGGGGGQGTDGAGGNGAVGAPGSVEIWY